MNIIFPTRIPSADARYPARVRKLLGDAVPTQLTALGNLDLLIPTQDRSVARELPLRIPP